MQNNRRNHFIGSISILIFIFVSLWTSPVHAGNYQFEPFDYPGAVHTLPSDINDAGMTVGYWEDAVDFSGDSWGFTYDGVDFSLIQAPPGSLDTGASGINDAGVIVGGYVAGDGLMQGYIYDGNSFTTISFAGADSSAVYGINNQGEMSVDTPMVTN